jgi:hypothetical protein
MENAPSRTDVLRQLELLRGGLRIVRNTIRRIELGDQIDGYAVLRQLSKLRADADQMRAALTPAK